MLKHALSGLFLIVSAVLCFNLGHAQTSTSPQEVLTNTLNSIQPGTPPGTAVPPVPGAPAGTPGASPTGPTPTTPTTNIVGKYEEHQSICRLNEYDQIKDYSDDLKKRRVNLLKNRTNTDSAEQKIKTQLRLVKEYLDQKNSAEALSLIQELKKQKLGSYDNEYLNALAAMAENRISTARALLTKLSLEKENAQNVELLRTLAEVYLAEQNYYEAGTLYEDLNKITNNSYLPQLCETMILNSLNADAEKVCRQAASKFPSNPLPPLYIGISHRERLDLKQAEEFFKKSISVKPTEMGHTCLAELHFLNKKFSDSVEQYKKALSVNDKSVRAALGWAWSEIQAKNYAGALEAFKKSCGIDSKSEMELRKAYKFLNEEKIPMAEQFIQQANRCTGSSGA